MKSSDEWTRFARGVLKGELKRRDLTYEDLSQKLKCIGVRETPSAIINKVSRGRFTAVFLFQCMKAIGCDTLRLED